MAKAKKTFIAKFADGTVITRTSHRNYLFAWRITYDVDASTWKDMGDRPTRWTSSYVGFSMSRRTAEKCARPQCERRYVSNLRVEIVEAN